jgi:hypothetical protein
MGNSSAVAVHENIEAVGEIDGFQLKRSYMLSVAPGWVFLGKVVGYTKDEVYCAPAAWVENVKEPRVITEALIEKDPTKVIDKAHPMERLTIRRGALLWSALMVSDASVFSREIATLKNTR